jgi:hypothetical protein
MTTFAQELLAYAKTKLGEHETDNNMGPIVEWSSELWTNKKPDKTGWLKWCAGFVSTCVYYTLKNAKRDDEAKEWLRIGGLGVTPVWVKLASKDLIVPGKQCLPGDFMFFGPGPGKFNHIALVSSIDVNEKGEIIVVHTIEGNCSDSVKERVYKANLPKIYGYARLPY